MWRKCELVLIKIGKVITGVMMRTTIVDVNGMEETVVVIMFKHFLVPLVNVWILIHALIPVIILTGKMTMFAMMKTTIVDVNGMEETVVVKMLTHNGVQLVNV